MRNFIPWFFCALILFASCKTQKPLQYFGTTPIDTAKLAKFSIPEPIIQRGDLLGIVVFSDNPEATSIFNQVVSGASASQSAGQTGSGAGGASSSSTISAGPVPTMPGYLVDYAGNIQMHAIGYLKAEGLTREQLAEDIKQKLTPYLTNPYATVRIQNFKVTVLGEVGRPGVISYTGDHLTILQAIGMAGDIAQYGLKDSVMLIREYNGKRQFATLDLTKANYMETEYYYLQQNDLLIVKTNPKRPTASVEQNTRRLAFATAIMTILTSLTVLVAIFK